MSTAREHYETLKSRFETPVAKDSARGINDTWYNRFLTLAAIKLLRRWRPRKGGILLLTRTICVKNGELRHLPEAATMDFIAKETSFPVPRILCAFTHKGSAYIVMEKLKGEMLAVGWLSRSADSKAKILRQLKDMVQSMRSLKPPSLAVANVDGGRLWDCRLPGTTMDFGPFENIDVFHQYLRGGFDAPSDRLPAEVNELIRLHDRDWPPPVLTHGDLSSLNILAEGDNITGIVDWETAGWYPYYWEYTTASQVNPLNPFWADEIDKFLEPLPEELRMEKIRQVYNGDVT